MRKKKLLLVGEAVDETAGVLEAAGYDVAQAGSARDAVARMEDDAPDLVLFEGLDVPDDLALQGIPIVMLAEVTGPEPAGARRVIYTPCRPRTLIERVEHVLRYAEHRPG